MKAVQIMFDERLLAQLDATEEVQREGRSAVLRKAAYEYLRARRSVEVREQYRRAYAKDGAIDSELAGWKDEGVWPDD
ncbi:MAG: hypothetical protein MI724_06170 [Spirochaetales bacterium]|nr:hypothetical protein [Spirochaetales bacterium]